MSTELRTPQGDFLFLHIPKTGGHYVLWYLSQLCRYLPTEYRQRSPELTDNLGQHALPRHHVHIRDYRRFVVVVRNPYTWLESYYRYQSAHGWKVWEPESAWHPFRTISHLQHLEFPDFVAGVYDRHPGYLSWLYRRYVDHPYHHGIRPYVLHQEALEIGLVAVLQEFLPQSCWDAFTTIPPRVRINASPAQELIWPEHLRTLVRQEEHWIFQEFYTHESHQPYPADLSAV